MKKKACSVEPDFATCGSCVSLLLSFHTEKKVSNYFLQTKKRRTMNATQARLRCVDFSRKQDVDVLSTLGEVFAKVAKTIIYIRFLFYRLIYILKIYLCFFCNVKRCALDEPKRLCCISSRIYRLSFYGRASLRDYRLSGNEFPCRYVSPR